MKRVTSWLFIISLISVLGVIAIPWLYQIFNASYIQKSQELSNPTQPVKANGLADLPILAFCELANNPEKYNGKTVRVNASLNFALEDS
jgi:hypothetical protein